MCFFSKNVLLLKCKWAATLETFQYVGVNISEPYRRRTPGPAGGGISRTTSRDTVRAEAYLFGTPPVSVSKCMRHRYQQYNITAGSFFFLFSFLTRFAVRRSWKQ